MFVYEGTKPEQELYEDVVNLGMQAGLKAVMAKVHAVLFMEAEEISLEDIAKQTGYSLASVSTAAKHLETFKKAQRIKKPGSKKVYYKGEKNMVCVLHEHIKESIEGAIKPMQQRLPYCLTELKKELKNKSLTKEKKKELKKKITWYESYLEQNELLAKIFDNIEKEFTKHENTYR